MEKREGERCFWRIKEKSIPSPIPREEKVYSVGWTRKKRKGRIESPQERKERGERSAHPSGRKAALVLREKEETSVSKGLRCTLGGRK